MTLERIAFIDALAAVMVKHGLSRAIAGDVELHRPDAAVFADLAARADKKGEDDDEPDEITKLHRMSPDQQDAALTLAPTR